MWLILVSIVNSMKVEIIYVYSSLYFQHTTGCIDLSILKRGTNTLTIYRLAWGHLPRLTPEF